MGVVAVVVACVAPAAATAPGDPIYEVDHDGWVEANTGAASAVGGDVVVVPSGGYVIAGTTWVGTGPRQVVLAAFTKWGEPQTQFSGDGIVTTATAGTDAVASAAAVDSEGRIVVAGWTGDVEHRDFLVLRYRSDGRLDRSFSGDGMVTTRIAPDDGDDAAADVAIQPDGKIIVVGSTGLFPRRDVAIVRYLPDGTLDTAFDDDGIRTDLTSTRTDDDAVGVAIDAEGHIVVAATNRRSSGNWALALRYTTTGRRDRDFGENGLIGSFAPDGEASALAVDSRGRIVVAGQRNDDIAVWRYTSDGVWDVSFSGDGQATVDFAGGLENARGVAIDASGRVLVSGSTIDQPLFEHAKAMIVRLNTGGGLDPGFGGGDGVALGPDESSGFFGLAVYYPRFNRLDPGRLLVAGTHGDKLALFAYNIGFPPERCLGEFVTVDLARGQSPTAGPDVIMGTDRADRIRVTGNDVVCAKGGHDDILVVSGTVNVDAGDGNNSIIGGPGPDVIRGGRNEDSIQGGGGNNRIYGGDGADTISGGWGNDTIVGGEDDDVILGGSGNDTIDSGGGFDRVTGGSGNDTIDGGTQADELDGNDGDDVITGGAGSDKITGGNGTDRCDGGGGTDTVRCEQAA